MKRTMSLLILLLFIVSGCGTLVGRSIPDQNWAAKYANQVRENRSAYSTTPAQGYVPDEETAIKIAVSVWEPMYGKGTIKKEAPYVAYLVDDLWVVSGSLPPMVKGGYAVAVISKRTAEVLNVIHFQ